jgi:hypothetical protein
MRYAIAREGEIPDFSKDTAGEFGKPNPPAPFPGREGGAGKPLSFWGGGGGGARPIS